MRIVFTNLIQRSCGRGTSASDHPRVKRFGSTRTCDDPVYGEIPRSAADEGYVLVS